MNASADEGRLWRATAMITASCAVIMTGLFAWKMLSRGDGVVVLPPVPVENWEEIRSAGHRIGSPTPKVTIVTFSDFECPACRRYTASALQGIRVKFPAEVQVVFRHYPLDYHRFALPSARAAECAAQQGMFESMHDLLYREQDSLGLKPFSDFARQSGVADTNRFAACLRPENEHPSIARDKELALRIGATGTPTLVIEGMRYRSLPDSAGLDSDIRKLLGR